MQTALKQDLTSPEYWDQQWTTAGIVDREETQRQRNRKRTRTQPFLSLISRQIDQLFDRPIRALEIGCAPGYLLAAYAQLRPQDQIAGVDYTEEGLQHSRELFDQLHLQAQWHQADVRTFVPTHCFDFVFSCGLIEHFSDPVPILKDHARLCQPGGLVAVSIPNYSGSLQRWFMQRLDPGALRAHNTSIMNLESLKSLLLSAGLKNIQVGGVGTATLRSMTPRKSISAQLLRRVAQTHNVVQKYVPKISCRPSTLWGYGLVN